MPHHNKSQPLQDRAAAVMASVREELGEYPVTIDHEAYSARGPILAVRVSNSRGARTSKDFDFKAEDDLSNARLVNAIVRLIRERFETASSETKE